MTVPMVIEMSELIWKTSDTMFWNMFYWKLLMSFQLTNRYLRSGLCRPIEVHLSPKIENKNAAVWQASVARINILIA